MQLLASSLLVGATIAVAASPPQQVLRQPLPDTAEQVLRQPLRDAADRVHDALKQPFETVREYVDTLGAEARAVWDEIAMLYPDEMNKRLFPPAKKTTRRPDSHWDHIVRGADIQKVWVENAKGQKQREIDGKLEDYSMRIKKVDPSKLGVDPNVKQYSGYLDDASADKHLFYCKLSMPN